MDVYGGLSVDDLLDLPSDDCFFPSSSSAVSDLLPSAAYYEQQPSVPSHSSDFNDILCVPTEDAAELEWLSNYMDDSFNDFPENELTAVPGFHPKITAAAFHGRARSKRSRPSTATTSAGGYVKSTGEGASEEVGRRCTHCASEKTPQWRTGPEGPKTLCNACGVRYKSGRLVPEYRPAASPTFVLTQHSNSHRKVMELRRQKEMMMVHQQQQQQEGYGRHFRVC